MQQNPGCSKNQKSLNKKEVRFTNKKGFEMLIVISDSTFLPGEAKTVTEMFRLGLDLFHIRKYGAKADELRDFIGAIDSIFHERLVLHHNHDLGRTLGLKRFHFSEQDRLDWEKSDWKDRKADEIYSTSLHTMEEYNALSDFFRYAFLSPVFDSISKPHYHAEPFDFSQKHQKPVQLIALGGINAETMRVALKMGFDGVAVLGAIWKKDEPLSELEQIIYQLETKI